MNIRILHCPRVGNNRLACQLELVLLELVCNEWKVVHGATDRCMDLPVACRNIPPSLSTSMNRALYSVPSCNTTKLVSPLIASTSRLMYGVESPIPSRISIANPTTGIITIYLFFILFLHQPNPTTTSVSLASNRFTFAILNTASITSSFNGIRL